MLLKEIIDFSNLSLL